MVFDLLHIAQPSICKQSFNSVHAATAKREEGEQFIQWFTSDRETASQSHNSHQSSVDS